MKKLYDRLTVILFCVFIGGMLVISLCLPKRDFSEMENRALQAVPRLRMDRILDGSFMGDCEDYISDHIAGRDFWISVKAWGERLSGKKENNGVYFADGDTLLVRTAEPEAGRAEEYAGYVRTLTGNTAVPVYFALIPTAASVLSDRLPEGAPTADEPSYIERMYKTSGARTADIYGALSAHSDAYIYYRTDHHWTSLGAYYAANALLDAMDMEPLDLSCYEKKVVSGSFYGTSYSSSGAVWTAPDRIETYISGEGVSVTGYPDGKPVDTGLYDETALGKKDKYSYFLGGNQGLCVIRTQNADAPKILLIRDSYADSLAPFLTERFSEIHLFDVRYNRTSIRSYIEENGFDAVVVISGFSKFLQYDQWFLLTR